MQARLLFFLTLILKFAIGGKWLNSKYKSQIIFFIFYIPSDMYQKIIQF